MPLAFPTKFFLRIGAPIPLRRRFGPQTDTTRGEHPTEVEQSGAVYLTGDTITAEPNRASAASARFLSRASSLASWRSSRDSS